VKYWSSYPELKNKEKLRELLVKEGSISLVANKLGCPVYSVKNAIRHHGIVFPTSVQAERILCSFKQ
jgi:hypothetical protein